MTKGISFNFNADGEISIKPSDDEKQECFGGVLCVSARHEDGEYMLDNGVVIPTRSYFCLHANKPVTDLMLNQCPVGRWANLKNYHFHDGNIDVIWGTEKPAIKKRS
jgi:hypothetical protein